MSTLTIPADLTIPDWLLVAKRGPVVPWKLAARTVEHRDPNKPRSYYTDEETRAAWDAMEAQAEARKARGLAQLAEWKAANPDKVEEQKQRARIRRAVEKVAVKGIKATGRAPRRKPTKPRNNKIEW